MDHVLIGVDTHKDNHIAVAIDAQGARLGSTTISTTRKGYQDLEIWAAQFGQVKAFGIEGTGSFGAGLSRDLLAKGHEVLDVMRPNRQLRYLHGKSDSLDAESAARSVLNGQATAIAKTQTGSSEMIRHLKVARDSAVKAKSQAMITLKALIVNAPAELRDMLDGIRGRVALVRHVAAWRPGEITSPTASAKPMPLSAGSPLCACAMMKEPRPMPCGELRKAKPDAKLCAASSATSSAKYTVPSAPHRHWFLPLDKHRSINALCESFFATLECELLDRRKVKTKAEARVACFEFIEGWYTPSRRHSALGYKSPINYERTAAEGLESTSP